MKFFNDLKYYTVQVNESQETAEAMEQEFIKKFNSLDKYSQLELSFFIESEGWESGFDELDRLSN